MKNYIVGNWKMNQSVSEIEDFFQTVRENLDVIQGKEAWIAPQFIHYPLVKDFCSSLRMKAGVQNCSHTEKGAFTGDVSPVSLKEMGADFVIIGHSERRAFFKESDEILNQKVTLAIKEGLTVIFCIGETLEERERGEAESVCQRQLELGLKGLKSSDLQNFLIAYEPVWAIGTGKTATPKEAQDMHHFTRKILNNLGFQGSELPILYGGSVKPSNVQELLDMPDINGALVGGASLKADDFLKLCNAS